MPPPDFSRRVHCVMGLPFDAVSEAQAEAIVRDAAATGRRCFMSTPNLNIAVTCLDDLEMRESVLRSDLSVADGMPIVALARLLRAPLPERVSGSGLFERLMRGSPAQPLKVFFFGGDEGVAALAAEVLASGRHGVTCAGHDSPGFGSVEEMSRSALIDKINVSDARLLVVAVGARKGQAWLLRNLERLRPPVLAYLGAVINFVAGTVRRAPRLVQRLHLEWAWRIVQEPSLWRRYWRDGVVLLRVFLRQAVPAALLLRLKAPSAAQLAEARLTQVDAELRLEGAWTERNLAPLREALQRVVDGGQAPRVDLSRATYIDSAVTGLLVLCAAAGAKPVVRASRTTQRILRWTGAGYVLAAGPLGPGAVEPTQGVVG